MARYLVATRRALRGSVPSAIDVVGAEPGVTLIHGSDPNMVTIETTPDRAERLRVKLKDTHFVEPETRHKLSSS
jgi:hypothetical protein